MSQAECRARPVPQTVARRGPLVRVRLIEMIVKREPRPALSPFVESLWAMDERNEPQTVSTRREHVLPTGLMHVVFRLSEDPLRLFADPGDTSGETVGDALIGGARASFYIREVLQPSCSVGAQLRPGAAQALFGSPADELAGRHTRLVDVWGRSVASIRAQLAESSSLERRLDLFEAILADRLPSVRGLHPAVAQALQRFSTTSNVHDVVRNSGFSHRTFISLFLRDVGLTPKRYCRVLRFRRALQRVSAGRPLWVDLAVAAGFSDQAHFNREFREFAGVTPGEYSRASPRFAHHVPIQYGPR
jgi:AraC-like DNA-binding protein